MKPPPFERLSAPLPAVIAPAGLPARFAAAMRALGVPDPATQPGPLLVAVSGGGDSMALLCLLRHWCGGHRPLLAVTVDHDLRPGSAAEAQRVAEWATALEVPHRILRREQPLPAGGLQAAARQLRYSLLADAAADTGATALLLGHTRDDQVETVQMRQRRGSGPAGLGGMAPVARRRDLAGAPLVLRPLLGFCGAELRSWLQAAGQAWLEDPSNRDPRFERVRLRQDRQVLRDRSAAPQIAAAATAMRRVAAARDRLAAGLLETAVEHSPHGHDILSLAPLAAAGEGLACHALRGLLGALGPAAFPPRLAAVGRLWRQLCGGTAGATLAGSRFLRLDGGDRPGGEEQGALRYLMLRDRRLPLPALRLQPGLQLPWGRRFRLRVAADFAADATASVGLDLRELGPVGLRRLDRLFPDAAGLAQIHPAARPGLPALCIGAAPVALPTAGLCLPLARSALAALTLVRPIPAPFEPWRWESLFHADAG